MGVKSSQLWRLRKTTMFYFLKWNVNVSYTWIVIHVYDHPTPPPANVNGSYTLIVIQVYHPPMSMGVVFLNRDSSIPPAYVNGGHILESWFKYTTPQYKSHNTKFRLLAVLGDMVSSVNRNIGYPRFRTHGSASVRLFQISVSVQVCIFNYKRC